MCRRPPCYSLVLRSTLGGLSDSRLAKTLDKVLGADTRDAREADARQALAAIVARSYPWDGSFAWPDLDERGRGIALTAWFIGQAIGEGLETSACCGNAGYAAVADKALHWLNVETDALVHLNRRDKDDLAGTMFALLYLARPAELDADATREYAVAAAALATVHPEFVVVMEDIHVTFSPP